MDVKTIFISDVHLGCKESHAERLLHLFKTYRSDNLIMVGDIIDGWRLRNKWYWPQEHSDVVQKILRIARKGTQVQYITGNHDEFLRNFAPLVIGNNIVIRNSWEYRCVNGLKFHVVHGDKFDGIIAMHPFIYKIGDFGYDIMCSLNKKLNWIRRKLGLQYWSLSKWCKQQVKAAVNFLFHFEKEVANETKSLDCQGVVTGHVHTPVMKIVDGIYYLNCGDWVESCTAIVETNEGIFQLIHINDKFEIKILQQCSFGSYTTVIDDIAIPVDEKELV